MALYVKGFSLLLKTVSKPMAKSLKSFVQSQPVLKKNVIAVAQRINQMYSYVVLDYSRSNSGASSSSSSTRGRTRGGGGLSRYAGGTVKPLSEEVALTNGSELVSEIFLFSVAGGLVYWEAEKSNERDRERKRTATMERQQLKKLMELTTETLKGLILEIEELKRGGGGGGGVKLTTTTTTSQQQ